MRPARLAHGADTRSIGHVEELRRRYAQTLSDYLVHADDVTLGRARDVGAFAVHQRGTTLADIVLLHDDVFGELWAARKKNRPDEVVVRRAAARFLAEALSPFTLGAGKASAAGPSEQQLAEILERETRRLASVLHDSAGQLLFGMQLALTDVMRDAPPRMLGRMQELLNLTGQLDDQLRSLSHELHPAALDELGLGPALRVLTDRIASQNQGLQIDLAVEAGPRLPPAVERGLYRGAVEALSNVVRHAAARRVDVRLARHAGRIICTVSDDGVGFVPGAGREGVGLSGIRTRLRMLHGSLSVHSEPGRGTTLTMSIPLGRHG